VTWTRKEAGKYEGLKRKWNTVWKGILYIWNAVDCTLQGLPITQLLPITCTRAFGHLRNGVCVPTRVWIISYNNPITHSWSQSTRWFSMNRISLHCSRVPHV
jgi:hypothetical protein